MFLSFSMKAENWAHLPVSRDYIFLQSKVNQSRVAMTSHSTAGLSVSSVVVNAFLESGSHDLCYFCCGL